MPRFRTGTVVDVVDTAADGVQQLTIDVGDEMRTAVLFPRWAAPAGPGDTVVVNTTAVDLELGTGGSDFVVWNHRVASYESPSGGHIMKLRYTPAQCDVLAVESPESPHHSTMANATSLGGVPVIATSLHSQLLPVLCGLRSHSEARVAYVMTDGAALEAGFSSTLRGLRDREWLCGVVTSGHAIGGDLESVTLHSGLLAARHVLEADVIVAGIGPGVVGTATPYGTTALELGTIALAAQALGGTTVVCVRLSEADPRERHRGLSHHVVNALGWVAGVVDSNVSCVVAPTGWRDTLELALAGWRVVEQEPGDVLTMLADARELGLSVSHMGRKPAEDKLFFEAAAAAGAYTASLVGAR
jgi:hypothetical protein